MEVEKLRGAMSVVESDRGLNGVAFSQFHSDCLVVKNITVSVEDDLYHAARVAAAQRQTNVTALLRSYLTALVRGKPPVLTGDGDVAADDERKALVKLFADSELVLGYKPSRQKTYER